MLAGEHWTAYVPFAARWPIEIHVLPHRHVADIAETNAAERDELATLYLRVLRGVDALYDTPPRTSPPGTGTRRRAAGRDPPHAAADLPPRGADKLKFLAGSESAMGAWVGTSRPSRRAAALRDAVARADRDNPSAICRSP